jgi:hypothetical protein
MTKRKRTARRRRNPSDDKQYNGWTNYETWRVNLEIFDGQTGKDLGISNMKSADAAAVLKEFVEELMEAGSTAGLARDYAMAFVSEVNFYEIAKHLNDEEEND